MSAPMVRFVIWLIGIIIALFIGVVVMGQVVSMPTQYFWDRDMATEWFLIGWPLAIVAGTGRARAATGSSSAGCRRSGSPKALRPSTISRAAP